MIDFLKQPEELVLRYVPEMRPGDCLVGPLEHEQPIPISNRTFYVSRRIYRPDFDDQDFAMDACSPCKGATESKPGNILGRA
ncbi:MAG: hypothetical protein NTW21_04335 [Verrucomicrobia bacterium]|nr:hypothetical protein [Verrucomicrobiota bacterium]